VHVGVVVDALVGAVVSVYLPAARVEYTRGRAPAAEVVDLAHDSVDLGPGIDHGGRFDVGLAQLALDQVSVTVDTNLDRGCVPVGTQSRMPAVRRCEGATAAKVQIGAQEGTFGPTGRDRGEAT